MAWIHPPVPGPFMQGIRADAKTIATGKIHKRNMEWVNGWLPQPYLSTTVQVQDQLQKPVR